MKDLRFVLQQQEQSGLVRKIDEPTSHVYEAARAVYDDQESSLQLLHVPGYDCRLVAGICSTRQKLASALGVEAGELIRFMKQCVDAPAACAAAGRAGFQANVVENPDLGKILPLVQFYPRGERRYLTSTIVAAKNAAGGTNWSFHRMMLLQANRLAVRVVPRHLHAILENAGGKIPALVFCGVHPAVEIAAATSVEPDVEESAVAAAMLGGELGCVDMDGIRVPAHAEVVMQGRFTGELGDEGPFVDLTSTYDDVRRQPVFEVDRLFLRDGFIYRTILPGGLEHKLLMGLPQEPRLLRIISNTVPSLVAAVLTSGGCSWLHAVVAIRKRAEGEGRNAGLAALAAHPSLKRVIVVDEDIDPLDTREVEWALATRLQPDRDVHIIPATKGSSLDPSRNLDDETSAKWILDATLPRSRDRDAFVKVEPPARKL
ncbi:MAG: UbiD family decarboxylase [Pseudomonadota bacterium]